MARMKFLCDADRCIECNACVTACKNENEVPWGINRRRVVTINDGKPGERSVPIACMHCTDAPCAAVCPVELFLYDRRRCRFAFQGSVYWMRLLLLCVPLRRSPVSPHRQFLAHEEKWISARTAPGAPSPIIPSFNTKNTVPSGGRRASYRSAPKWARRNLCTPATVRSSRRSTKTGSRNAGMDLARGDGERRITTPSRHRSREDGERVPIFEELPNATRLLASVDCSDNRCRLRWP